MKKYQSLFSCMISLFGIIGIVSYLYAAEIIYAEGQVQVQAAGSQDWQKAEKGTKVNIGDSVRTARHSKADIALDDEKTNTIHLEPKTLIVLNSSNPGLIDKLDLSRGKVYSKLENIKAGLSFEVTTPSAVAGVRGSAFSVYAEKDSDEVQAYKDTAFVQSFDEDGNLIQEVSVPEGFKTLIERFEGPGALIQVSQREFSNFDRVAEEITSHEEGKDKAREEKEKETQEEQKQQGIEEQAGQVQDQSGIIEQVTDAQDITQQNTVDQKIKEMTEGEHSEY